MKKINEMAINHRESAVAVDIKKLRDTGVNRDSFRFLPNDVIEFPEETLNVWMDTFTPTGSTEAKEYYLITAQVNGKPVDITMASMRRSRLAVDEDVQEILKNEVCRALHQAGDDEQRAVYLLGKCLKVTKVLKTKSRFDDSNVYVPIFEEIDK